jgi:hypothetical protein
MNTIDERELSEDELENAAGGFFVAMAVIAATLRGSDGYFERQVGDNQVT